MAATSIKVAIPRDIQDFEARFIGPLTKRQTVLFVISSIIGYGLFKLLGIFKMELAMQIMIAGSLVTPILACGWVKMLGMPLETYIMKCVLPSIFASKTRPYKTINKYISGYKPEQPQTNTKESEKEKIRTKLLLKKYDAKL